MPVTVKCVCAKNLPRGIFTAHLPAQREERPGSLDSGSVLNDAAGKIAAVQFVDALDRQRRVCRVPRQDPSQGGLSFRPPIGLPPGERRAAAGAG
jgi:hypothetical protein